MLSKAFFLLSLLSIATASEDVRILTTPPTTKCATIGKEPRTTRSYTRNSDCTNYVTKKTIINTSTLPVTTSIVYNTSTITASTITSVATFTSSLTVTETTAITETDTSISTLSVTDTITSVLSFTGSLPNTANPVTTPSVTTPTITTPTITTPTITTPKITTPTVITPTVPTLLIRNLEEKDKGAAPARPTPKPGVVCVIDRCLRRTMHITVTDITTLPTSTATSTSEILTTVTPLASVTSTVTANFTTFSTITQMTTIIQTSTLTQTITTTTLPNFNIIAEKVGDPSAAPNGAELNTNALTGDAAFGSASGGSTYSLDPVTGQLMDVDNDFYAYTVGSSPSFVFFDSLPAILATPGSSLCQCESALTLTCNCGGSTVWQMNGAGDLIVGNALDGGLYSSVTPVVSVVEASN